MKKMIIFLAILTVSPTLSFAERSSCQGCKPYTPTRLEWLAMELNIEMKIEFKEGIGMDMCFSPSHHEDAIIISVVHEPNKDKSVINNWIKRARESIKSKASSKGWEKWLKINESVDSL